MLVGVVKEKRFEIESVKGTCLRQKMRKGALELGMVAMKEIGF